MNISVCVYVYIRYKANAINNREKSNRCSNITL